MLYMLSLCARQPITRMAAALTLLVAGSCMDVAPVMLHALEPYTQTTLVIVTMISLSSLVHLAARMVSCQQQRACMHAECACLGNPHVSLHAECACLRIPHM